jgi:hypothetical protein
MDDKRLERIEVKLDEFGEQLNVIDKHLAVYNEQLKVHIKGTEDNRKDIKSIQKHVYAVQGIAKVLGALGVIAAIIEAIRTF